MLLTKAFVKRRRGAARFFAFCSKKAKRKRLETRAAGIIAYMKKQCREVIYLIGDSDEKRRMMREELPGIARAMNDEVTDICRMNGKDYYVVGKHPFSGFTVAQYVRYRHALLSDKPLSAKQVRAAMRSVGLKVRSGRRLGSLGYMDRRLAARAGSVKEDTRTLVVDLDGVPYSRSLRSSVRRAAKRLKKTYEVWISVTDSRLADKNASLAEMRTGSVIALNRITFRCRPLSRRLLLARLRRCFAPPSDPLEKGRVIEVSKERT